MEEMDTKRSAELAKTLKPVERRFVREYLMDLNGTQAAIRAGYKEKTAPSAASRLLRKPEVRAYRDALLQEAFEDIGVTQYTIAHEVWEIFRKCMQKEEVMEWNSAGKFWERTGIWQFDVKGALKALGMLSDMLPQMKKGEEKENPTGLEALLMTQGAGGGREF